jgi:GntR family carbon starvation induced transcriptional regulator
MPRPAPALSVTAPASPGSAVTQTSLAHDRLRDGIIRGELAPGTKLKIETLQDRYGLGATPLREALSLLTAAGLVEREDQRGFRVSRLRFEDFADLLSTRCFLEEHALRESIALGQQDWEERVLISAFRLAQLGSLARDAAADAVEAWEARNASFHAELISACSSRRIRDFCAQLFNENRRYCYFAHLIPGTNQGSAEEHQRIADAALARDAELAITRLIEHYRSVGDLLLRHLHDTMPVIDNPRQPR